MTHWPSPGGTKRPEISPVWKKYHNSNFAHKIAHILKNVKFTEHIASTKTINSFGLNDPRDLSSNNTRREKEKNFTFNSMIVDLYIQFNVKLFGEFGSDSPRPLVFSCLLFYHVSFTLTGCKMILSPGWHTRHPNELLKCFAAATEYKQVEINSWADTGRSRVQLVLCLDCPPQRLDSYSGPESRQSMSNLCPNADSYQH